MIPHDAQKIKGMNGIVKNVLHRSPAIGLHFLNSRVLSKKILANQGVSSEASERCIADCIDCIDMHGLACEAIQNRDRYHLSVEERLGSLVGFLALPDRGPGDPSTLAPAPLADSQPDGGFPCSTGRTCKLTRGCSRAS